MAKPDNRADNVERLQESIENTQENLQESESYLNEFGAEINSEERNQLEAKNERRKQSIAGQREEMQDEQADRQS
ncbi:MAG: small acid-soluble spore protein Tlp [Paenibacillaceae bacterium]|uniref:small acid-soluble spore protein Tlp n=1 Tax=Paenibacillus cymbidii TaxID=1639034 RepID=UPI0010801EFE|nr:small acid-soluble spore protein Tlp [Paenibacillus cymbidii]MBO9605060.1 small acid-soluble spore protein Tlp [Paenibacillaceae bacterium]